MDMLQGKSLIHKEHEIVSAESALKKKNLILFYFTTDESEACRAFDSKLKRVYQEAAARKVELAIIVISSDSNKESYSNNIKKNYLDWYSVLFEDDLLQILKFNYGITHVPSLVVVTKNGTIITKDGVNEVEKIGINVLVTWTD